MKDTTPDRVRKTCTKCGESKAAAAFSRDCQKADGLCSWCKGCVRDSMRAYRAANANAIHEQDRRWREANVDDVRRRDRERYAADRERGRAKGRQTYARNADAVRARAAAHKERFPEQGKAHDRANKAIRSGRLRREPCEMCGHATFTEAHHDDYGAPLDVRWLCRTCHRLYHARLKREGVTDAPTVG